ncbi:MAG: DNA translocase FtsK 4TM domain-containing protein [Proteobacteria bacterium]|nr:DNA translocase FtsK 4TM domain-containing protein [Pseudomonadota bacterium]
MASRSTAAAKPALLPPGVVAFLRRRAIELAGAAIAAVAVVFGVALASFDAADPSLNTATAAAAANLAGPTGAIVADLALQSLGAAAALVVAVPLAWAWRLVSHHGVARWWLRAALLPFGLAAAAAALAALPWHESWPLATGLGGAIGMVIFERAIAELAPFGVTPLAFAASAALVALAALVPALGLSLAEWRALGLGMMSPVVLPLRLARRIAARAGGDGDARRRREPQFSRGASDGGLRPLPDRETRSRGDKRKAPAQKLVARRAGKHVAARQETLELVTPGEYQLPPLSLLTLPPDHGGRADDNEDALAQNARMLETVLDDFGVQGEIVKVRPGPVVTLYELEPAPGTKSSRVISLADDIARSMSAVSVRVALIPGRSVMGIELPNNRRETVYLRELLAAPEYEATAARLTLALGKSIGGAPVMTDLARMPHLLVAGTTGSGKSVALNTMILSLLYRLPPDQCKMIMIDPKMLELSAYDGIPHLLAPVVTDPRQAVVALKWVVREMENRYRAMSGLGARNIAGYNKRLADARGEPLTRRVQTGFDADSGEPLFEEEALPAEPLPHIVIIVDEMADLMMVAGKEVEGAIQRLAQMARAAGIHLIMATQRPSVDVITGTIKANFPTRISFQVTSKIDSRTILGDQGAEQLLGQGDMLHLSAGGRIERVHGPFVSEGEVERVAAFLREQGRPDYIDAITEDDDTPILGVTPGNGDDMLYDQAVALVCRERKASTSFVQRHLQIGYNRAARIIEHMEAEGIISRANHVGRREVLANDIDGDTLG